MPSVIATSSTMWCWRSPFAFTVRSNRPCVASEWSMWSRNAIPVLASTFPVPSSPTRTVMSVSFVFLVTSATLFIAICPSRSPGGNNPDGIWFTVSTTRSEPSLSKKEAWSPCTGDVW